MENEIFFYYLRFNDHYSLYGKFNDSVAGYVIYKCTIQDDQNFMLQITCENCGDKARLSKNLKNPDIRL